MKALKLLRKPGKEGKRESGKKFYVLAAKLQNNENVIEKFDKVPVDNKLVILIDTSYQGKL